MPISRRLADLFVDAVAPLASRCGAAALIAALLAAAVSAALAAGTAPAPATLQRIDRAQATEAVGAHFPADGSATAVPLPDDWSQTRPGHDGSVWYRTTFDAPDAAPADELLALYIERVCSNAEVQLNGRRIFSSGETVPQVARNCHYPQLVTLPASLLRPRANLLDVQVHGHALEHVAAPDRAGGLAALVIGPRDVLAAEYANRLFWRVTSAQIVGIVLAVLGGLMVGLGGINRRSTYLAYFGWLSLGWALLSLRVWWRDAPWSNELTEILICTGFAVVGALTVQFLLSYAALRRRRIGLALAVQCAVVPAVLAALGPAHLHDAARALGALLALEVAAAMAAYLAVTWRERRADVVPIALWLAASFAVLGLEAAAESGRWALPPIQTLQFSVPLLLVGVSSRLLQVFARALQAAEDGRTSLEGRVAEITAEIERNFAQLAELRVEQVTEKERKRIAGDLHDDLGAKLLTIVHTSESERISTLAREALEEMRLSVRGLTGKPMRLADALADWRAETVLRLGQANIEADWRGPSDEIEELLPARGFVQTTRILREAVSNIIKHSGASHCKVRCAISDRQFGLTVQDNGKGIPMELDGKLDRGHGMSSMKHRAKQMQGQCLVESGPGYGTVIRLTLPL